MAVVNVVTKDELDEVKKTLDVIVVLLKKANIVNKLPLTVTVKDIAKMEGVHISYYNRCPWMLPDFGEHFDGKRTRRWDMDVYLKWRELPEEDKKAMYKQHLESGRKRYCLAAKRRGENSSY